MKTKIRYELAETEKFNGFEYKSNMTTEEIQEVVLYRAELVRLLNSEVMPLNIPPRPPVFDRYK